MTTITMPGADRLHRLVAVGSGFVRLTATKALKRSLTDIADVLAFLTRITGRGVAQLHTQWLQVLPTTVATVAGVGVFIALYAATGCGRASRSDVPTHACETVGQVEKGWH
ncbi:hypothetical protein AWB92_19755 [Mycobacterium sp. IEC1808]|uniref:hypothetical protein n=1 Tax=Mycobacterium sp. IEC1808 TaxID=1743230 RepID=UPI000A157915|nr:hypothetical protein [Mycobacterium sp. IEC1808]ORW90463.1 hypothetical protein AWB92_19755 [Mycobacterium sp. IEC1808]